MTYWLLKPIVILLTNTPLGILHGIGRFMAFLTWHLSKERRRIATINAKIAGAKDPVKTARESFDYTFMSYMENFYAHNIDEKFLKEKVTITGGEYYEKLKNETPKFVLVGAHFGTWALLANIVHKTLGANVITIGRASRNKALDRIMAELRTFEGIAYITHRGAIEQLATYMDQGYNPGVYLDHTATPKDCVNVPFFGFKTPTIAGIPAFAARKNLPILPFFGIYKQKGYEVIIYPPIYPDKLLKPKERIEKIATDINKVYEDIFSKYPEQWYLLHRRFKRVEEPDGTISDRVYRP